MLRLDPAVYEALERWAADEFRSVNGQLEWIIDTKLKEHRRGPGKSSRAGAESTKNREVI